VLLRDFFFASVASGSHLRTGKLPRIASRQPPSLVDVQSEGERYLCRAMIGTGARALRRLKCPTIHHPSPQSKASVKVRLKQG
jgi:hypothetical protein